jgi:hypothetical protein
MHSLSNMGARMKSLLPGEVIVHGPFFGFGGTCLLYSSGAMSGSELGLHSPQTRFIRDVISVSPLHTLMPLDCDRSCVENSAVLIPNRDLDQSIVNVGLGYGVDPVGYRRHARFGRALVSFRRGMAQTSLDLSRFIIDRTVVELLEIRMFGNQVSGTKTLIAQTNAFVAVLILAVERWQRFRTPRPGQLE